MWFHRRRWTGPGRVRVAPRAVVGQGGEERAGGLLLAGRGIPASGLWVPRTRSRHATCTILVYEAAEPVSS